MVRLTALLFVQIFLGGGEHQLDTVQLVYLAGTGVIVDGYNVCQRILMTDLFDDTFSYDMVRQAAEGLGADDVVDCRCGSVPAFHR